MLILGLLLVGAGAAGLLISFFGASVDPTHRSAEILNWDVAAGTLVLWGAASTFVLMMGLWCIKYGAKQSWKHRKEQKKYEELNEKLAAAERREAEERQD